MVVAVGLAPTKRTPPKEVTRSLDLSHVEMVGPAGFEPALCIVPNDVPYQVRRRTDKSGGCRGTRTHTERRSKRR